MSSPPAALLKAAADRPAPPEATPDKLEQLLAMIRVTRDLEALKGDLEERLKATNIQLWDLKTKDLPDFMSQLRIPSIDLEAEGNHPTITAESAPFYKAAILSDWPEEQRADAFRCLEEQGAEDLIKTEVVFLFARRDHARAKKIADAARAKGHEVIMRQTVHWATLTSWLKEMIEKRGVIPPLGRIGATYGRMVTLKESSPKKNGRTKEKIT